MSTFSPWEIDLEELLDLETYPIHDLNSARRNRLIKQCRHDLAHNGCSVLPNFLRDKTTEAMASEALHLLPRAYHSTEKHNPYFTVNEGKYQKHDPRGFYQERSASYITSDDIGETSTLKKIYDSDVLVHFVAECINQGPLYRWADPVARAPFGIMQTGDYFPWHFDGNEFTVTMLIQNCDSGGVFEYRKDVRSDRNENFAEVQKTLEGSRDAIRQLQLRTGDLQLFKGRYSLHRVTQVEGPTPRIVAIPSYVKNPYTVTSAYHCECLYGKSLPIHKTRNLENSDKLIG